MFGLRIDDIGIWQAVYPYKNPYRQGWRFLADIFEAAHPQSRPTKGDPR